MADRASYRLNVIGWMDSDDNRHRGQPPDDTSEVYGLRVELRNPKDKDDYHQFWAYTYDPEQFETWAEWYVYVGALAEAHGLALAAE